MRWTTDSVESKTPSCSSPRIFRDRPLSGRRTSPGQSASWLVKYRGAPPADIAPSLVTNPLVRRPIAERRKS